MHVRIAELIRCSSSFEAQLIKGNLNANGIECILVGENISVFEGSMSSTFRPGFDIPILVNEADLEKARKVLEECGEHE